MASSTEALSLIIKAQDQASGVLNQISGSVSGISQAVSTAMGGLMAKGVEAGFGAIKNGINEAKGAVVEYQKSMTTLEIVAPRFNVGAEAAKKAAADLGKELRIGTGPAAESLQNLLKSGLNLDQSIDLMKRFTNEAMTGKSANISLSQAVENLSFAFQTGNSALGNMSGVSENFSDLEEKGAKQLGKKVGALSDAERMQARYLGMIETTNLTMGSAAKFTGTLADKEAERDLKLKELHTTLGQKLEPVFKKVADAQTVLFDKIGQFVNSPMFDKMVQNFSAVSSAVGGVIKILTQGDFDPAAFFGPFENIGEDNPILGFFFNIRDVIEQVLPLIRDNLANSFNNFTTNILPMLSQAFSYFTQNILPVVIDVFKVVATTVVPIFNQAFDILAHQVFPAVLAIFDAFLKNVLPHLKPALEKVAEAVTMLWQTLVKVWNFISPVLIPILMWLADVLGNVLGFALDKASSLIKWLAGAVSGLISWIISAWNTIASAAGGIWSAISNMANGVWNALTGTIGGAINWVKNAFWGIYDAGKAVGQSVVNFFGGMGGSIRNTFTNIINSVIGRVNGAVGGINDMIGKVRNLPGMGWLPSAPSIPYLNKGGTIKPGEWAVVGDNPDGTLNSTSELIKAGPGGATVLSNSKTVSTLNSINAGNSGGGQIINIQFNIQSATGNILESTADEAVQKLKEAMKRAGFVMA